MKKRIPVLFVLAVLLALNACTKDRLTVPERTMAVQAAAATPVFNTFSFTKAANPALKEDVLCYVAQDTIFSPVPAGTTRKLKASFSTNGTEVQVNGLKQESGKTEQDFTKNLVYTVKGAGNTSKKYVVVIGSQLPTVLITTTGSAAIVKDTYVTGELKIQGINAGMFSYQGSIKIKGRGNSTWNMPKKPYKFKLDSKASLLGLPADKTWVLLANYADKSMMRNELAFELSRRMGMPYTPASRYVEVVLNGSYEGTYELVEQIDVAALAGDVLGAGRLRDVAAKLELLLAQRAINATHKRL